MPYRPSSDGCDGDDTAWTATDGSCNHGLAFPISFDLTGTTLPDKVIIGVAYNTSHYGASPLGVSGPYDSLNVGTSPTATTGTPLPTADDAYLQLGVEHTVMEVQEALAHLDLTQDVGEDISLHLP